MTNSIIKIPFNSSKVRAFVTKRSYFNSHDLTHIASVILNDPTNKSYKCIVPIQTHSANIGIVNHDVLDRNFSNTDALITNESGKVLCIKTADCAPILLFNSKLKVIAAIHAGWKGTAQNIVGKTLEKMKEYFFCDHTFTEAFIGPCISQKNYEVGQNVYDAFQKLNLQSEPIFTKVSNEKYLCSISEANKQLLIKFGVKENNLVVSDECTYDEHGKYFSARREGFNTGRIISGIVLI